MSGAPFGIDAPARTSDSQPSSQHRRDAAAVVSTAPPLAWWRKMPMVWIILAVAVVVAVVANEIRIAPEQDDGYEVRLQEQCRRMQEIQAAAKLDPPPKSDAA